MMLGTGLQFHAVYADHMPCLSTIATLQSESRSLKFTLLALAWALFLAWVVSFVFHRVSSRLIALIAT